MDEQTIRQKLHAYITRELIRDAGYDLGNDEGIISGGLMDSFDLAELAVYIENEFNETNFYRALTVRQSTT